MPELGEAGVDRAEQARIARLQEPAAEHDLDGLVDRARAASSATRTSATTSDASRVDDARRDRVGRRLGEHERCELDDAPLRDRARVHGLRQLERRPQTEVRGHGALERRVRAAPVLAAGRGHHRRQADVVAAAPVAGDRAERGEAGLPAVRRQAEAVDAGAADDGDAPAAVGAGAEDGEGVVPDLDAAAPSRAPPPRAFAVATSPGKSTPASSSSAIGDLARVGARLGERLLEQRLDPVERAVDAVLVRRAARPAHERER